MNKNEVIEYLVTKIEDEEEPLFLLRGRDVLAPSTICAWCERAKQFGASQKKIDEAMAVSVSMALFPKKKFPD